MDAILQNILLVFAAYKKKSEDFIIRNIRLI